MLDPDTTGNAMLDEARREARTEADRIIAALDAAGYAYRGSRPYADTYFVSRAGQAGAPVLELYSKDIHEGGVHVAVERALQRSKQ